MRSRYASLAAASAAIGSVDLLDVAGRERLERNATLVRIKDSLDGLRTNQGDAARPSTTSDAVPLNWCDWLSRLRQPRPWSGALAAADIGSREWSTETLAGDHSAVDNVARLLLEVTTDWGAAALRDALPHLLDFCIRDGADTRLRPVYESLFVLVATDEQVSTSQVAALLCHN